MNTKGVEDGTGAKQRVLAVYPDATIARDHHSAYYAFTKKGAGGRISGYVGSEELAWQSAAYKLPAAVPSATSAMKDEVESASTDPTEISDYGLPYTVKCPECYAEPGEACYLRLPSTTWRQWPHIMRGELAAKSAAHPSPTLKDEVHAMQPDMQNEIDAMIDEHVPHWNVSVEARRQLGPLLEELVERRKRKTVEMFCEEALWEKYCQLVEVIECDQRGDLSVMKRKDFSRALDEFINS